MEMAHPLFDVISIGKALDDQRRKLAAAVAELPPDVFRAPGLDDLAAELVAFYRIDPLVLNWDAMTTEPTEVEIDVGGDVKRGISDRTQPFKVSGTEITRFVPFSGAPGLFDMRPSTHTKNPPRGFVRGADLTISYSGVDADLSTFRSELDQQQSDAKAWVAWIKADVDAFNADLPGEVRPRLEARFDKARADANLVAALGVPLRQRPATLRDDLQANRRGSMVAAGYGAVPVLRRGPGRPGWTRDLFEKHWREARAETTQPQSYVALAEHFRALDGCEGGLSSHQLRRLRHVRFPE